MRKIWNWIKHRIQHKAHHLKLSNLVDTLKEHGLALVVIIVVWEIIEDVLFPVLFFFLGNYVHPVFYAGAPAAWLLKISKKKLTNNKKKDIFNIR